MRLLGLKTFRHGVHPPESKDETSGLAIRQFPFAPLMVIPLVQHAGKPSVPVVQEGQEVTRGECIARPDGFVSVSMHAPASGIVRRIALTPSITGRMVPGVYLEPHPGSTQEVLDGTPCPVETATPDEIIEFCREHIGGYKVPKVIDIRGEALPKSGPGKVLKRELRAPFWAGRDSEVN